MTTAFLRHARLAAKNLKLEQLPLIVTPHPLNDLTPAQVEALARAAYPAIIAQLTDSGPPAAETHVAFPHPAQRAGGDARTAEARTP